MAASYRDQREATKKWARRAHLAATRMNAGPLAAQATAFCMLEPAAIVLPASIGERPVSAERSMARFEGSVAKLRHAVVYQPCELGDRLQMQVDVLVITENSTLWR